jgi:serine/threonine protein kinase
VSIW